MPVKEPARISTQHVPERRRSALIRDAAAQLFNLDVDFAPGAKGLKADIACIRHAGCGVINVRTSASTVTRTQARVRSAGSNNLLVYLLPRGGSHFENARGDSFSTAPRAIVVGSVDAAYSAHVAAGAEWRFQVLSLPEKTLALAAPLIRTGYQIAPSLAPVHPLLSTYLQDLFKNFATLDEASAGASLSALDHLLCVALGSKDPSHIHALAPTVSRHRFDVALRFITHQLQRPELSADTIAVHLRVSQRQLHRVFNDAGTTVAGEIRTMRLARASQLVQQSTRMPITDIAFSCGFDSMATFYRVFKARFGATASEYRMLNQADRGALSGPPS
jgi:AraC-like DNA-binding protein